MSSHIGLNYSINKVEIWEEHLDQWGIHLSWGDSLVGGQFKLFKDFEEFTFFKNSWVQSVNSQDGYVWKVFEESSFLLLRGKLISESIRGKYHPPMSIDGDDDGEFEGILSHTTREK